MSCINYIETPQKGGEKVKKNKQKLLEKMKAIQRQLKELEKAFYIEFAKAIEKGIQDGNLTAEKVKEIYESLKQKFM